MNIVQRKAYLNINGFTKHKANKRGTTIIFSRKHTTDASVRVVVDSFPLVSNARLRSLQQKVVRLSALMLAGSLGQGRLRKRRPTKLIKV